MTRRSLVVITATLAALTLLVGMTVGGALAARPVWTYSIPLTGDQEVGGGDEDARGRAIVQIRPDDGVVCFNIGWKNIDGTVWGGHIHNAPAGSNGGIVVGFFGGPPPSAFTDFPGEKHRVMDCVGADPGLLWSIVSNPDQYYVNVHSTVFGPGAVRGQLD